MSDPLKQEISFIQPKYEHIRRKNICSNSKFNVFFDHIISPDNKEINDFLIVKPKVSNRENIVGICVLPMLNERFCLMQGWRHQFKDFIFQAPAGFIEKKEEPSHAAIRELEEETSLICEPKNLISLGSFIPDSGLIEGRVALFLASHCTESSNNFSKEIGSSEIIKFSKKEIQDLIKKESNIGGSTLVVCMRSLIYLLEK